MTEIIGKIVKNHEDRRAILADIEDNDGVISPLIEEKMRALEKAVPEDFDNLSDIMDHVQGGAEYCRAQAKKWSDKARQLEDNHAFMSEQLKHWMTQTGQRYVHGNDIKYTCFEMKPRLVIGDEGSLPAKYFKEEIVYVLDKDLVRKDYEAGEFVPTVRTEKVIALRRSINIKETEKKPKPKKELAE